LVAVSLVDADLPGGVDVAGFELEHAPELLERARVPAESFQELTPK
jgi:hypothetical protein